MSRLPPTSRSGANGTSGYTNGYYGNGGNGGYGGFNNEDGDDIGSRRRPSGERRNRRPGGYGGFGDYEEPPPPQTSRSGGYGGFGNDYEDQYREPPRQVARPTSLERTQARRRSGGSDRSRSRNGAGRYGDGSQQLEEILQYIQQDWQYMTDEKCVPVQVALKLLDSSSLGLARDYNRFQGTHQQLQRSLKAIVNEHHQGFNSSIGTFHKIQTSLQASQTRVRTLRDSLTQAKSSLSTTKPELKEFATSSQNYDEMIQVLNVIEQLQLVPDKLEGRISEKRFLSAVDVLQDALKMIRRSEMEGIGALSGLRVYLSNQEHSLTDILIEELHNHLYLKSPYCEDRWKVYAQNQEKNDSDGSKKSIDTRGRLLFVFLDETDLSQPMVDDSSRNPEADTFQYIQLVVEALNKMNRLEEAIDTIEERLPEELFKVVERSNNEVAQRHPSILRAYAARRGDKFRIGIDDDDLRTGLLNDLLWTVYARFEAIAEGHRVVHDVVQGMVRRENIRDASTLTRGFKELWKLYQSEMRSLLHDYLSSDGELAYGSGQKQASVGSVFAKNPRDKNKRMFKLSDMNQKSTELTTEREDLEFILKSSVPGLVSDSKTDGLSTANNNTMTDGSATGHKLLIEPSVFNMGILLPPSLEFLNRLKAVVPKESGIIMSTLTSSLDHFLVNVFLPQTEETLAEMSEQTFIELDAFQQEPEWAKHSKKPIFKSTAKFFTLITAFCKMLDNLPHDQAFSNLIISQMQVYYEKCRTWYKILVNRSQPKASSGRRVKFSAAFAEAGEIEEAILNLFQADSDKSPELVEKETRLLISEVDKDPLDEADLILDRKNITGLCLLYTSIKWIATKIAQLRHISDRATDSSRQGTGARPNRRWTLLSSTEPRTDGGLVYLPLNKETAAEFDSVVLSYQALSITVLKTLHLEIRAHILHALQKTIKDTYQLDQNLDEPDPEIIDLNNDLVAFDAEVANYIPSSQYRFITTGLAPLMDTYLLRRSTCITLMNAPGCALMQLHILVLQQDLRNIEPRASLPMSAAFFDLFTAGPDVIVTRVKETGGKDLGMTEDEVKKLVELCYSEKLNDDRREVNLQAKRGLDDKLLQISEYMWQS